MKGSRFPARSGIGVIALLIISAMPAVAGHAFETAAFQLEWQRYRLANGLQVLLQPDARQAEVVVEFWVHAGSRHEPPGRYGLAHFAEHATPYGFRDDPERAREFREALNNGNARTLPDFTRYYLESAPEHVELLLAYAAQRLGADAGVITPAWVERHRANVLREMTERAHTFWAPAVSMAEMTGMFGAAHPYGHGAYGTVEENQAVRVDDLRRWFRAHLRPRHTTLFVAGHFDPADVRAVIEREFADIPGAEHSPVEDRLPQPAPTGGRADVVVRANQPATALSWPVAAWGSDDAAALRVLAHVLHQRLASSHARPSVVGDDAAGVDIDLYQHAGRFRVMAMHGKQGDSVVVERWLRDVVAALVTNGLSNEELDAAREQELASLRDALSRTGWTNSRIDLLGRGLLFEDDPDAYLRFIERMRMLSSDDIHAAATRWLAQPEFVTNVIPQETAIADVTAM